jgi:hypothetical protein
MGLWEKQMENEFKRSPRDASPGEIRGFGSWQVQIEQVFLV